MSIEFQQQLEQIWGTGGHRMIQRIAYYNPTWAQCDALRDYVVWKQVKAKPSLLNIYGDWYNNIDQSIKLFEQNLAVALTSNNTYIRTLVEAVVNKISVDQARRRQGEVLQSNRVTV